MEGGVCYTSIHTTITIDNRREHGRGVCAIHQSIQLLPLITDGNMEGGVCYTSIHTTITIGNRQEHGRGGVLCINLYN
jgi:hypothetical protein